MSAGRPGGSQSPPALGLPERGPHPRGRGAGRRVLGQAGLDQGQDRVRDLAEVRFLVDGAVDDGGHRARAEGAFAGEGVREDAAEREDVGGRADLVRDADAGLFGGEEAGGADHRVRGG